MPAIPDIHRIPWTCHLRKGDFPTTFTPGGREKLGLPYDRNADESLPRENQLLPEIHPTVLLYGRDPIRNHQGEPWEE